VAARANDNANTDTNTDTNNNPTAGRGNEADAHPGDGARTRPETGPDTEQLRHRVGEATARLTATAAGLTDHDVRQPSALPGWTRGHLLTHIARNADGLRNLLVWARTGVPTPQYPSTRARDAGIEAGAGRGAAELLADLRGSAAAFDAEAAALDERAWQVAVRGMRGPGHPAWLTLVRRLVEVEVHHVDLGAGFGPADWPGRFVREQLPRTVADFADRPDAPACRLRVTDAAAGEAGGRDAGRIGPTGQGPAGQDPTDQDPTDQDPTGQGPTGQNPTDQGPTGEHSTSQDPTGQDSTGQHRASQDPARRERASRERADPDRPGRDEGAAPPTVAGPEHALLAWLTGRSDGAGLTVTPPGAVPHLPPWLPNASGWHTRG
jgi:maleylpyruvate isomerase